VTASIPADGALPVDGMCGLMREVPPYGRRPQLLKAVGQHRTVADEEAAVLVFEPAATRNAGNVEHAEFTAPTGVRI
jgi:hypothetical protein